MTEKKLAPTFMIDTATTIKWPVIVHLPVDGGEIAEFLFTGEFKRLSEEELDNLLGTGEMEAAAKLEALIERVGEPKLDTKRLAKVLMENAELFPQILVGWEGVQTASGEEALFRVETLKKQITGPNGAFLSTGLWRAIAEIRNGARLGN